MPCEQYGFNNRKLTYCLTWKDLGNTTNIQGILHENVVIAMRMWPYTSMHVHQVIMVSCTNRNFDLLPNCKFLPAVFQKHSAAQGQIRVLRLQLRFRFEGTLKWIKNGNQTSQPNSQWSSCYHDGKHGSVTDQSHSGYKSTHIGGLGSWILLTKEVVKAEGLFVSLTGFPTRFPFDIWKTCENEKRHRFSGKNLSVSFGPFPAFRSSLQLQDFGLEVQPFLAHSRWVANWKCLWQHQPQQKPTAESFPNPFPPPLRHHFQKWRCSWCRKPPSACRSAEMLQMPWKSRYATPNCDNPELAVSHLVAWGCS